jgi:hypothetical protein
MSKLEEMSKQELRTACRKAGISYGKLSNESMRAALKKKPVAKKSREVNAEREERNGVKRPRPGGLCAAVWSWLDAHKGATSKDVKAAAPVKGWNLNNASIEFYQWRKFNAPPR